jgi:hypothetical protein
MSRGLRRGAPSGQNVTAHADAAVAVQATVDTAAGEARARAQRSATRPEQGNTPSDQAIQDATSARQDAQRAER